MKSLPFIATCGAALLIYSGNAAETNSVSAVFAKFVKEKYALEERLAKKYKLEIPSRVRDFFAAAGRDDWTAASNLFEAMRAGTKGRGTDDTWMPSELWSPAHDTFGAYGLIHVMKPKFLEMLGVEIVKDIPSGSIYFGGTDSGRFLPTAFSQSHSEGKPFFTLTQNALADPTYLTYIADIYGDKIKVADTNDSQQSFADYMADARVRIYHDQKHPNEPRQVKPGEDVHVDNSGHVQVTGQVAVMAINAFLTKAIFEKNPGKEFFVEESFPLDWMFPHLTPFGAIMKINREEIPQLTEDILKRDHEFWSKYSGQLIGNWITYDTPVKDVTAFAEKVFLNDNYSGFQGDLEFIHDEFAQKAISKLRSSIAGVYTWRIGQPPSGGTMPAQYIATGANRKMIEREADFAFKQSFAFCPYSPEAIFRYVQLLVSERRVDDALLIAETGQKIAPNDQQLGYLIKNLKAIKSQTDTMANSQAQLNDDIARLENEVKANPTNFLQQFELAQKLFQIGKLDRAYEVLDGVLANPQVTVPMVTSVADAYNRLGQPRKLQAALEKLTQLAPDSPEAWYDLAASRASLNQTSEAMGALKQALDLNSKRLKQDAKAKDVRVTLADDPRFAKLRDTSEFKALMASH